MYEDVFKIFLEKIPRLSQLVREIQRGVAGDDIDNPRYRVPAVLVNAFQDFVESLVHGATLVSFIRSTTNLKQKGSPSFDDVLTSSSTSRLGDIHDSLDSCKRNLMKGPSALVSMVYTNDFEGEAGYEAVGVETIVALVLEGLVYQQYESVTQASIDEVDIYTETIEILVNFFGCT